MILEFPYSVPHFDSKNGWGERVFEKRSDFKDFVTSLFKEPGLYEFNETSFKFNEQARLFNKQGYYCSSPHRSKDFIKYWDDQKLKCKRGVIFTDRDKTWYITRDYYMWLNFLPIYDKEKKRFDFPQVRDAQYHMALYECLAELNYKHSFILKKRQIASEQPHSEPVLGEHGWITMGDLKIGDKLWNPDGTLTKVLNKFNNGVSDVYEFEFIDGRKTRCGIEHNWEVYDKKTKTTKVLNTKQLLKEGIIINANSKNKKYNNYRFSIKTCNPIPLKSNTIPINPYVLGALLGDGHINHKSVTISGADEEVFNYISKELGSDYNLNTTGYYKKSITYKNRFNHDGKEYKNSKYGVNPLLRELLSLGLGKKGKNTKFIPDVYKTSSIESRISLIQGMLDTDGYINKNGNDLHFTNVNKRLALDFAEVCRSLGLKIKISTKKNKNGEFYRVRISGNIHFVPFRLSRKKIRFEKRANKKTFDLIPIVSIKKLNYREESSCILVDNPNHLYITKDYIVTHNSYFHAAKLINQLWFEEGVVLKMGASLKKYINSEGTWKYIEEYRSFLNENTAWYRPMTPDKEMNWQQKIEVVNPITKRKNNRGLKGVLMGTSFEKDPTAGVGGPTTYFFHEEAGIAPKMDDTYNYMVPSMKSGLITTGMFIGAGSVGDLDQCEPLKKYILHPDSNDVFSVETDLIDDKGTIGRSGLFIPEQWSMPPYIDQYGNSLVEEALEALDELFKQWKQDLDPKDYQMKVSQHPRNIKEAFDYRSESVFATHLVTQQMERIENKEYPLQYVDIYRLPDGKIEIKPSRRTPIKEFPVSKKLEDKRSVIVIHEKPVANAKWGTYYASVDPVGTGKTSTSESLCAIYIYKAPVEVTYNENGNIRTFIEGDKIVAWWCGRYDDINDTNELLELLIEYYGAWTIVENNVSTFINHMIAKKKQKYLVPKEQILFLKELKANLQSFRDYGWYNSGLMFSSNMLPYAKEFIKEKLSSDVDEEGVETNVKFGVERIPDIMLCKEMMAYRDGMNVDRLISFVALVCFIKIQAANRGIIKEYREGKNPAKIDNKQKSGKLNNIGGFRNLGQRSSRSPFKNFR